MSGTSSSFNDQGVFVDTTDYSELRQRLPEETPATAKDRFQKYEDRKNHSVLSVDFVKTICHGKYQTSWKGVEVMRGPLDMIVFQQLLWEVRPVTVFEIGAFSGGNALWMADILRAFDCSSHIYSMDIDASLVDERAKGRQDITFIQGDSNQIDKVFSEEFLKNQPHPWFLIEDAHVNVLGVLEHFHVYMKPGDYISVEDTNPDTPTVSGMGLYPELGYEAWGTHKLDTLKIFMEKHSESYRIDRYFTDFFGYNGTWNWNGYLKRI